MRCYLFLFIYIFFSCASQGYPSGGPIDNKGPKIIKSLPINYTQLESEDKIVIFFDELINPISTVNAITIFPKIDFSYKISGKKIIITPTNKWINSNVLKIKLSRKISDYQNNFMDSPIELFYFNSNQLSNKLILGEIFNTKNQLFELGLYKINNSNYELIEKTESNQNNNFEFKYLDSGKYFIVAIEDSLVNIQSDIMNRQYGMITDSFINLTNNDTIQIKINIDKPVERLSIKSFDQINNNFGYILYTNGQQAPFIISDYKDSLVINMQLKNRLESYVTPDYSVFLTNIIDTIKPNINFVESTNNLHRIILSEPIQYLDTQYKPFIFYLKDSIYYDLSYKVVNPFTLEVKLDNNENGDFFITNLTDLYNNSIIDTLPLFINSSLLLDTTIIGGNVYGSIIYDGQWPIIIKAKNLNSDNKYYASLDANNEFSILNIEPGFYNFSAFEFFGDYDSTQYFSGLWSPVSRAAKFGTYNQNLEIRKHWDIKDMIIEIK